VARLDLLVISHEDMDHLGGALSVLESTEVGALASSLAPQHPLNALVTAPRRCAAGEAWQWDGVRFEFLHPAGSSARRNNMSCVLRISTAGGAMLLTGDIERQAEFEILQRESLSSEVLLVPHHGSRTSSTVEFIAAVAPRWAVVPAGYRNRFGHPNGEVLERYRAAGVRVMRTDLDGAVSVFLNKDSFSLEGQRARRARYWLQ
jgi:competence protein ComEC